MATKKVKKKKFAAPAKKKVAKRKFEEAVLFNEEPLLIEQEANGSMNFDFDSKHNTGWMFDTNDVGEACAILCTSEKYKNNEKLRKIKITKEQVAKSDPFDVIYWLSGGNKAWKFGDQYKYSYEKTFKDLWKGKTADKLKKDMSSCKTIGDLIDVFKKEYTDYPYFYDDAMSNGYTPDEEDEMAKGGTVGKKKVKKKFWIADALSGGNKGALRKVAKRKGILHGKHDKLTIPDVKKLEKVGGKVAKEAHLAETLMKIKKKKFEKGGGIAQWDDATVNRMYGMMLDEMSNAEREKQEKKNLSVSEKRKWLEAGEEAFANQFKPKKLKKKYEKGGTVEGYEKFVEGSKVKTTVYMSEEDVGVEIPVGTEGTVFAEPSDDGQLVGVSMLGALHYLPQDVLEVEEDKTADGDEKVYIATVKIAQKVKDEAEYADGLSGLLTETQIPYDWKYAGKGDIKNVGEAPKKFVKGKVLKSGYKGKGEGSPIIMVSSVKVAVVAKNATTAKSILNKLFTGGIYDWQYVTKPTEHGYPPADFEEGKIFTAKKITKKDFSEETIKYWELTDKLTHVNLAGDKSDLRLDSEDSFYWGAEDKKDYDAATDAIDKIKYKGNGWNIYAWYDVSGYDYWMVKQEEQNYIQITIAFKKEDVKVSEIEKIEKALDSALADADAIVNKYSYNPTNY